MAAFGPGQEEAIRDQVAAMVARAPYRGAPQLVLGPGFAVGVQGEPEEVDLWAGEGWVAAVHGFVGNLPQLVQAEGWPGDSGAARALLLGFLAQGERFFRKPRGEYSALFFSPARRQLWAVRDVLGLRPLFVGGHGGELVFAAEPRQVLAGLRLPPRPNRLHLARWLVGVYVLTNETFFEGVQVVLPARLHSWELAPAKVEHRQQPYWSPPSPRERTLDDEALAEELRSLVLAAVRRCLPTSGCAVSLSGGLDSPGIWGAVGALARQGDPRAGGVLAASLVFPGQPWDESEGVRRVLPAAPGKGLLVDCNGVSPWEDWVRLVPHLDAPALPSLALLPPLLEAVAAEGCRVIFVGSGGNEWLSGDWTVLEELLRRGRVWRALRLWWRLSLPPGRSRVRLALGTVRRLQRPPAVPPHLAAVAQPWRDHIRAELEAGLGFFLGQRVRGPRELQLQALLFHQVGATLVREQLTERWGVEIRHPYHDLDVLEWALALPGEAFLAGKRPRELHRRAVRPWLPAGSVAEGQRAMLALWAERAAAGTSPRAGGWRAALRRLGVLSVDGLDKGEGGQYIAQSRERKQPRGVALGLFVQHWFAQEEIPLQGGLT